MSTAFDTLKLADRLESAGFTPQQARGTAAALSEAITADLVTKGDLFAMRSELSTDIARLETKISDTKAEIIKWLVGSFAVQFAALVGVMKLFMH